MLMRADLSQLLIVDVQAKLIPAMAEPEETVRHCALLLQAAEVVGVPALMSEQYPQGLGPTVAGLADRFGAVGRHAKVEFSCLRNDAIRQTLEANGRRQVVVAGVEAHVCVLQTGLDLRAAGYEVFVVADAVSSRRPFSKATALSRLAAAGVNVVTAEMVVFEWAEKAGSPTFKTLSALVR
jgi:nicotinamidase-related amidase